MNSNQLFRITKTVILIIIALYLFFKLYFVYYYIPDINFAQLPLYSLTGEQKETDSITKNTAVIIFFQTWCGTCIQEMILINKMYKKLDFTNVYFITDESIEKTEKMKAKYGLHHINILKCSASFKKIGIEAFPTIYLIKNNSILEKHKGNIIDEQNIEDEIYHLKKLLQ